MNQRVKFFIIIFVLFQLNLYSEQFSLTVEDNAANKLIIGHMLYKTLEASPKDIKMTLGLWIKELSNHIGIPIEMKFYDNSESLLQDLKLKKINYIMMKPLDAINILKNEELFPGFAPTRFNNNADNSLALVTRKDLQIKSLKELEGKNISIFMYDDIGKIFLDTVLLEQNYPVFTRYFNKVSLTKNRTRALNELFFKKSDAALITLGTINMMREMNPQVVNSIDILLQVQLQLSPVAFFTSSASTSLRNKFNDSIPSLTKNIRAKQILTLFKADGLGKSKPESLNELRKLQEKYIKLTKEGM